MLADANLNYYRPRLGKWRPTHATLENVKKKCETVLHDETFMARDIHLILHCLNNHGYSQITAKNTWIRRRASSSQPKWRRISARSANSWRATLVEFWEEFFTSPHVSLRRQGRSRRSDAQRAQGTRGTRDATLLVRPAGDALPSSTSTNCTPTLRITVASITTTR